jgi:hypothetical protein
VAGKCSNCWSRVAVRMPNAGNPQRANCPQGHVLHIRELHSAGLSPGSSPPISPWDAVSLLPPRVEPHCLLGPVQPANSERSDRRVGISQPNASAWGYEHPYQGPPEEGQPRIGSKCFEETFVKKNSPTEKVCEHGDVSLRPQLESSEDHLPRRDAEVPQRRVIGDPTPLESL